MSNASANQPQSGRWWLRPVLRAIALAALLVVFALLAIAFKVASTASTEDSHPADAIVVFGAAEYSGRPSPVLRARLDHAFDLYRKHLAPVVITTGGAAADPSFSEGGVGEDYLHKRGIPENALISETQGSDTAESARRVSVIMRANGLHSCIAVSDAYHVFRIRKLLEHEGIAPVYISPRPDSRPRGRTQRFIAALREATSYLLWILGVR
jgi:uncharacterized SAM-binding protein YcdF (DUF218 family)